MGIYGAGLDDGLWIGREPDPRPRAVRWPRRLQQPGCVAGAHAPPARRKSGRQVRVQQRSCCTVLAHAAGHPVDALRFLGNCARTIRWDWSERGRALADSSQSPEGAGESWSDDVQVTGPVLAPWTAGPVRDLLDRYAYVSDSVPASSTPTPTSGPSSSTRFGITPDELGQGARCAWRWARRPCNVDQLSGGERSPTPW